MTTILILLIIQMSQLTDAMILSSAVLPYMGMEVVVRVIGIWTLTHAVNALKALNLS